MHVLYIIQKIKGCILKILERKMDQGSTSRATEFWVFSLSEFSDNTIIVNSIYFVIYKRKI